jgi:hypothetical protein
MKSLISSLALITLAAGVASAQQQPPPAQTPAAPAPQAAAPAPPPQPAPCSGPEYRQLDFWIGEWDVEGDSRVGSNPDKWQHGKHKNSITKAFDGCVIQENFDDLAGFHGMSVSMYDAKSGKWKQTWVDNAGSYFDLVGEFKDGKMVLVHQTTIQGKPALQRMVFSDIKSDSLHWDWESSVDDGKTWRTNWKLVYTRKK